MGYWACPADGRREGEVATIRGWSWTRVLLSTRAFVFSPDPHPPPLFPCTSDSVLPCRSSPKFEGGLRWCKITPPVPARWLERRPLTSSSFELDEPHPMNTRAVERTRLGCTLVGARAGTGVPLKRRLFYAERRRERRGLASELSRRAYNLGFRQPHIQGRGAIRSAPTAGRMIGIGLRAREP